MRPGPEGEQTNPRGTAGTEARAEQSGCGGSHRRGLKPLLMPRVPAVPWWLVLIPVFGEDAQGPPLPSLQLLAPSAALKSTQSCGGAHIQGYTGTQRR